VIPGAGPGSVQDEHPARAERGAYPVSDDDQGARPGRERMLGPRGRVQIQVAGRLVEYGQPGRGQMGPGQRDELALPGRQGRRAQFRGVPANPGDHGAEPDRVNRGVEFLR
jgi:hypothetical protein